MTEELIIALRRAIQAMNNVPSFNTGITDEGKTRPLTSYQLLPELEAVVRKGEAWMKGETKEQLEHRLNHIEKMMSKAGSQDYADRLDRLHEALVKKLALVEPEKLVIYPSQKWPSGSE